MSMYSATVLLSDQDNTPTVRNDIVLLSTVTPDPIFPDLQPQFAGILEALRQQMEENKPAILPKPPSEKCVFPSVVVFQKSVLFNSKGKATRSLLIVLEAMTGQHQELCPSRVEILLPLHNIDDQWFLVGYRPYPKMWFTNSWLVDVQPGRPVWFPSEKQ